MNRKNNALLSHLKSVNDVKIRSVFSQEFLSYGRVIDGYDFCEILDYLDKNTAVPDSGNIYVASEEGLERTEIFSVIEREIYGGMPIQIGYCNGKNSTYNGFEYHKGSELNIALTDLMLVLGHVWQIKNNSFTVGNEKVFFVPKGTAIEMYQTTLHLSPCKVGDEGFKAAVVLPKFTNTPLKTKPENPKNEAELLLQTNKWVIAHAEREPLVRQGAHIGLIGENKELKY